MSLSIFGHWSLGTDSLVPAVTLQWRRKFMRSRPFRVGREPEEVLGEMVSGNFFSGLGVQPFLGRGFTLQDETTHAPVVVLNYAWWKARFAGDANILDRTVYIKAVPFTVVGVRPPGFNGVDPVHPNIDFWSPLQSRPENECFGDSANGSHALRLAKLGRSSVSFSVGSRRFSKFSI